MSDDASGGGPAAETLDWLLDTDPALRWQVERDLADLPPEIWQATRERVATEGFGAELLSHQDADGQWAGGAYFPADFDWNDRFATGIEPDIIRLENGPVSLVLINAGAAAVLMEARVAYISVSAPIETLNELRGRALFASYTLQEDSPRAFRFIDPFGVSWQIVAE